MPWRNTYVAQIQIQVICIVESEYVDVRSRYRQPRMEWKRFDLLAGHEKEDDNTETNQNTKTHQRTDNNLPALANNIRLVDETQIEAW